MKRGVKRFGGVRRARSEFFERRLLGVKRFARSLEIFQKFVLTFFKRRRGDARVRARRRGEEVIKERAER